MRCRWNMSSPEGQPKIALGYLPTATAQLATSIAGRKEGEGVGQCKGAKQFGTCNGSVETGGGCEVDY